MINLNDPRLNCTFDRPINKRLEASSSEYYALALLKHLFPEFASGMAKSEEPDLQDLNCSVGAEVTELKCNNEAAIDTAFIQYKCAENEDEKNKLRDKIEELNGKVSLDDMMVGFPACSSDYYEKQLINILEKKCGKLGRYRKSISSLDLIICTDIISSSFICKSIQCINGFVEDKMKSMKKEIAFYEHIFVIFGLKHLVLIDLQNECVKSFL